MGTYQGIIVCTTYHSPNKSDGQFIDAIINECESLIDKGHILIIGDFNIDMGRISDYSRRLTKNTLCLGLKQYITEHTRVTETSKTIIDLVFTNFYVLTKVLVTPRITDHHIVRIDLYTRDKEENTIIETRTRNYKNINENRFCDNLISIMDNEYDENSDVNNLVKIIIGCITKVIDVEAPIKSKKCQLDGKSSHGFQKE